MHYIGKLTSWMHISICGKVVKPTELTDDRSKVTCEECLKRLNEGK